MFFLRKPNFKLRACNHHIKGLPFFRRPLVCIVCARAVFSIRFPCFFSWSGKLTYNRPNTRCSPERSRAANCIYQKHSTGLFTLCDLIKTCSRWECVSDCVWYKGTVSAEQNRSDHMKKEPHVNSIGVICLSLSNCSWYLARQYLPCWLAWWRYDCSHSLSHSFRLTSLIKTLGHILTDHLTFLNLHSY